MFTQKHVASESNDPIVNVHAKTRGFRNPPKTSQNKTSGFRNPAKTSGSRNLPKNKGFQEPRRNKWFQKPCVNPRKKAASVTQ